MLRHCTGLRGPQRPFVQSRIIFNSCVDAVIDRTAAFQYSPAGLWVIFLNFIVHNCTSARWVSCVAYIVYEYIEHRLCTPMHALQCCGLPRRLPRHNTCTITCTRRKRMWHQGCRQDWHGIWCDVLLIPWLCAVRSHVTVRYMYSTHCMLVVPVKSLSVTR